MLVVDAHTLVAILEDRARDAIARIFLTQVGVRADLGLVGVRVEADEVILPLLLEREANAIARTTSLLVAEDDAFASAIAIGIRTDRVGATNLGVVAVSTYGARGAAAALLTRKPWPALCVIGAWGDHAIPGRGVAREPRLAVVVARAGDLLAAVVDALLVLPEAITVAVATADARVERVDAREVIAGERPRVVASRVGIVHRRALHRRVRQPEQVPDLVGCDALEVGPAIDTAVRAALICVGVRDAVEDDRRAVDAAVPNARERHRDRPV